MLTWKDNSTLPGENVSVLLRSERGGAGDGGGGVGSGLRFWRTPTSPLQCVGSLCVWVRETSCGGEEPGGGGDLPGTLVPVFEGGRGSLMKAEVRMKPTIAVLRRSETRGINKAAGTSGKAGVFSIRKRGSEKSFAL